MPFPEIRDMVGKEQFWQGVWKSVSHAGSVIFWRGGEGFLFYYM